MKKSVIFCDQVVFVHVYNGGPLSLWVSLNFASSHRKDRHAPL